MLKTIVKSNIRQLHAPKTYVRDSGLLHALLAIHDFQDLLGHPKVGASWEGFAIEQVIQYLQLSQVYHWGTHNGAELDLFFFYKGKRYGVEASFNEAPGITRSMRIALQDLDLAHLWVIYPGKLAYNLDERISVMPLQDLSAPSGSL